MLSTKQIAGIKIDAPSVIKLNLSFVCSLENKNVHSAKKVWRPKKVTTKPMNLKLFKNLSGAMRGVKNEKIK